MVVIISGYYQYVDFSATEVVIILTFISVFGKKLCGVLLYLLVLVVQ